MGVCLERRAKKEQKAQLLWKENLKKRPRRDSNPRSFEIHNASVMFGNVRFEEEIFESDFEFPLIYLFISYNY